MNLREIRHMIVDLISYVNFVLVRTVCVKQNALSTVLGKLGNNITVTFNG